MALTLNLAALTSEELARLIGADAAQKRLPDLTRARMEGKAVLGPDIEPELRFDELEAREWGATIEHARRLKTLAGEFEALEYTPLGAHYAHAILGARHFLAFVHGDTAAAVRWSETPAASSEAPFVQLLTLLKDRASGFALVLTTTSPQPLTPAPNEEVAVRLVTGGSQEAHEAHRAEVARHGRGLKQANVRDWQNAFATLRDLNVAAWTRRGVLLERVV
ncbi:hypothetical protein [Deinococcus yavapaiensis]|uniref:Uncharacterized protein n=1 Tax=Deinococcus yavapaiensis KR-236 TaxID=694435 RepID=A0A318SCA6_9DEIO|nr:hypothetical protein [Deinococcus yavapaiensis]PYE56471.1 hypothetical protein DES52_101275 [Deinococcus yavapaiensis KR-236]